MRKTWTHLMVSDTFYFIVDDTVFCPKDDKPYCPLTIENYSNSFSGSIFYVTLLLSCFKIVSS